MTDEKTPTDRIDDTHYYIGCCYYLLYKNRRNIEIDIRRQYKNSAKYHLAKVPKSKVLEFNAHYQQVKEMLSELN